MRRVLLAIVLVGACGSSRLARPPSEPVDDDNMTALHAKHWKFAPYFTHLKQKIGATWNPSGVMKAVPPDATARTLVTTLRVELLPDGTLRSLSVKESSGVQALDDESSRALRAAAPFGVVPPGLEKDGVIAFDFSFYYEPASLTVTRAR